MNHTTDGIDDLILALLKANDTRASALLYSTYYPFVYNTVNRNTGDSDAAKDITQELFIIIWYKRKQLHITKPILSYLLRAAHNRVINYKNHRASNKRILSEVMACAAGTAMAYPVDVVLEARELDKLIKDAIASLPPYLRKQFYMSRRLRMTYTEIALKLKVSTKAVEKNMSKVLKLLRMHLAPYMKVIILLSDF